MAAPALGDLVLGIDVSTTSCKAIAWDAEGRAVAEGRAALALSNPEPDGWEQDARDWWRATCEASAALCRALGPRAQALRALCVTHQRETFVLADDRGEPLAPALVWMDLRCRAQVARAIEAVTAERLHELSGKPASTTPSLYKLMYLLETRPELGAAGPRALDVHAFVVQRLTGERVTSLGSADPTGLVDMRRRVWSDELLALAGLSADRVPALVEPGSVIGEVGADAAAATGLPRGLPVVAGIGDGQAAGIGAGIVDASEAYLNLGTAIVSGVTAPAYAVDRAFRTLYAATPGGFLLETDLKGGTFILSWLAEKLLGSEPSQTPALLRDLERQARELAPGSDGLLLVPYWNGVMNPYWDDDATGITVGWHGGHTPAHLYRAALEGIAFEQRLATSSVEAATGTPIERLVCMGGGSSSELWCRLIADVLQKPVVRAGSPEATALGAGMLAAVGAGLHPDLGAAARRMTRRGAVFAPGPGAARYAELYDVYRRLYPALSGVLGRLPELRRPTRASTRSSS